MYTTETEKESAMNDVLDVRRLLDEMTNPNCTDAVIKIKSIDLWIIEFLSSIYCIIILFCMHCPFPSHFCCYVPLVWPQPLA